MVRLPWLLLIAFGPFLCLAVRYGVADKCPSIPPSLWCSSDKIIKQCGFEEHCQRFKSATWNQRVNITVLVEALCPDCQQFIANQLYPVIYKNFRDVVNIQLVPFGNAKIQPDGSIVCQHGEEECEINKFESCLINSFESQDEYVPVIFCIESQLKDKVAFATATEKCFQKFNVTEDVQRMTQSCLVSNIGARLQKKAADLTNSVWPDQHKFVPWVVFNGVSLTNLQVYQNQIPLLICQWYNGDQKISYCESALKERFRAGSTNFFY
ncbi:unnamed protein product [Caenorhabditis auriculariae]|uniref:Saposin A-type domain-containing protein n=1 Tax=Caenorhabditis auriculariae TaxID=2777116 RepID=A0A8S1HBD9_9PELO|nr:unnamed protein product [Caenorhabditis auriculariae]